MHESIYKCLKSISPMAADFVRQAGCDPLWVSSTSAQEGCLISCRQDQMGLVFAVLGPQAPEAARLATRSALLGLIDEPGLSERCFNCRGDDVWLRALALELGFKLEMAGHHLCRELPIPPLEAIEGLRPYEPGDLSGWKHLLRESYFELCLASGWDPNALIRDEEAFAAEMLTRAARREVWSFYSQGRLVAGFRLSGSFIQDLLVLPGYQNQGLGTSLLLYASSLIMQSGHPVVQLRVAEENGAALRLYLRNHFEIVGFFAEHQYPGKL